jgi:glucokinase
MYDTEVERASHERVANDESCETMDEGKTAVVGRVGQANASFAVTDGGGFFREDTIKHFDANDYTTVSGALMAFKDEMGLASLPPRCALAVAGVPRGDTISVTNSRWFISRSGMTAILQRSPLVMNDFAANAWAVSAAGDDEIQPTGAAAPGSGPGTFLVVGIGIGLGTAAFIRDDQGAITVLPTEAGHAELVACSAEITPLIDILRFGRRHLSAEAVLSCAGMAALRNAIAEQQGNTTQFNSSDEVVRAATLGEAESVKAVDLFAKALWHYAGNLTLIFGAWDGVFMTGGIVDALRSTLAQPEVRQGFIIPGPYANLLRNVPAGFVLMDNCELRGAAEALRRHP